MVLSNLENLYREQGRYGEAETLSKRALAIYEKVLGRDHTNVATVLNNLESLYQEQGRYGKPKHSQNARWRSMRKRSARTTRPWPMP